MAVGPEAGGECGICFEAYRGVAGLGAPQQLPCSHSLCLSCLHKLVCHAASVAFVSCPFCRTVTLLPELAGAGGRDRSPCEEEEEEGDEGSRAPRETSPRSVACVAHGPIFAVSGVGSPEAPGAFVLGLRGRGVLQDPQPPLASMENLRLAFAAGILVLIVSTFFLLVFLK